VAGLRSRGIRLPLVACALLLAAQAPGSVDAAPPLVSPSGSGTVVIGPQAMEGNLNIHPGDLLRAGFDFTMPGSHSDASVFFSSGYVSLLVKCPDGSSPALAIQLHDQTILDLAGSNNWYPSGDQSNSLVYQGELTAPDMCAGGVMNDSRGALFTTAFFSTDTVDKFNFRFHYSDNTAGAWSATVQGVPTAFAKTVTSATLTPALRLALTDDHPTAIPGDSITYTATLTNTGTALTLDGDLYASATGSSTATVASYWDDVYLSLDGMNWSILAGTAAATPGYVPAVPPPGGSGLTLTPTAVAATGVTYSSATDPILATAIGSHDIAHWRYVASLPLTAYQAAALSGSTSIARVRNTFHLEVTPANPDVVQPAIVNVDFTGLLASSGSSATLTNLSATIVPPANALPLQFSATTNPSLASLASGASASVSGAFTVPPPPSKASGQSDADYFAALSALEDARLTASASAGGMANTVTVSAPPTPPVTTIEHLPMVSIDKSGPPSVGAGSTETNPISLSNAGGAPAEGLSVVDSIANGSSGSVSGVPSALAPGPAGPAAATYAVPSNQSWGGLTDTASVTWHDNNGNPYGPVSSSFTTRVTPPYGASAAGLFGIAPSLGVVVGIDPATGTLNTLADVSAPNLALGSNLAGDPTSDRLFEAELVADYSVDPPVETARLLTIDTTSGSVSTAPLAHPIVGLAFETSSGSLFAITVDSPRHVVRVDPVSGVETDLSDFYGDTFTPTAIDPVSHTFYAISQAPTSTGCWTSQLFSFNTETNTRTTGPVLTTAVLGLAVDPSDESVFAVTGCGPSQLVRLDPGSGAETSVGSTDLGQIAPEIAINPASHTIFVSQHMAGSVSDTRILSIDDQTGDVVAGPLLGTEVRALAFVS
jgi:hypothetical protein